MNNIFAHIPDALVEEQFEALLQSPAVRIERIVSRGHASPEGFWYDQPRGEWVLVLRGAARLRFEDEPEPRELKPGDFLDIPAHRRHRVESTAEGQAIQARSQQHRSASHAT